MSDFLVGRNPIMEALKNGSPIHKLFIQQGAGKGSVIEIIRRAKELKIPIREVERKYLDSLVPDNTNHQGVVAAVPAREYVEVGDILELAKQKNEDPFILMLDELEDPHNLGAVLRIADAVGVHGVIIPKRRAVGLTSTVVKTSAGAVEYVPVARVANLVQTVERLKEEGCWVVGADMDGELLWNSGNLSGALVCVIGNEGKGVSRLLKEKCDFLVKIPMKGRISSLNASTAAAVLCYEILRLKEKEK